MDIDFMKSSAEEQMEMMVMQMEKLPADYFNSYTDLTGIPLMDFTTQHTNTNSVTNEVNNTNSTENQQVFSPTFMNYHSSAVSIPGEAHQHLLGAHSFLTKPNEFPGAEGSAAQKRNSMASMREMIFRIAAMQPIHIDPDSVKPPKRRNVKISTDPQSVVARHRRQRISERIRILQRLVPGGTKMDTASMLDEAINYVKFLKNQVQSLEGVAANPAATAETGIGFPVPMSSGIYFPLQSGKGYHNHHQSSPQHLTDA